MPWDDLPIERTERWLVVYVGRGDRRGLELWWKWLAGPALAVLLGVLLFQAVPAWSAHLGHGRPGVWAVTEITCGKKSCTVVGDFSAADGGDVMRDVGLDDGGGYAVEVGMRIAAVDSGNPGKVYPVGGGSAWLKFTIGAAVVSLPFGLWLWVYPVAGLRRVRSERTRAGCR